MERSRYCWTPEFARFLQFPFRFVFAIAISDFFRTHYFDHHATSDASCIKMSVQHTEGAPMQKEDKAPNKNMPPTSEKLRRRCRVSFRTRLNRELFIHAEPDVQSD
ncbi:uncharacterized protein LOC115921402 [Strongylocentrotus purpuratus]|uniref:Uncharacterized protein n=1 Tax=Strongylocentrotus purpuratus TaxID=7668 RepID=A0A7M7ND58_STRPU|nr:uncharacterized protein LOC115921402 [Strongylocentrotus purpuratus]